MLGGLRLSILSLAAAIAAITSGCAGHAAFRPDSLRCEYRVDPLGIDVLAPRLSWILKEKGRAPRGQYQTAYQVLVATTPEQLAEEIGDLWDSGKIASDESAHVAYAGKPLESRMRCHWKVRAWDGDDKPSRWSKPALWTMGLLKPEDWKGRWIGIDTGPEKRDDDVPKAAWIWFPEANPAASAAIGTRYFRKRVELPADRAIKRAIVRVTADNDFTLFVNGAKVGAGSNFHQLFEFDVTDKVAAGANAVAVATKNAGEGPNPAGLFGLVRVEFTEGDPIALSTDATWLSSDAEAPGWEAAAFDDTAWKPAQVLGENGMAPWGTIGTGDEFRRLPARYLRREFSLNSPVRRATATVCGLGLFELHLNGRKVGDSVLQPALTDYTKRALYVTFDVTDWVKRGPNAIGVILGNGRYFAPRVRVPTLMVSYGDPRLLFDLRVECQDGTTFELASDEGWKLTTRGPIRANSEYDGEEYDARLELRGWTEPGADTTGWESARLVAAPGGALAAQMAPPIRVTERIKPVGITNPKADVFILDMGQNMVGWCCLSVQGPAGTEVRLRHAETLTKDGFLYLDNIRSAKVTDVYTLKGQGIEVYEPRFTYHGFRYVEITGYPGVPTLAAIRGCVVHDDLTSAGTFRCSDKLLEQLHRTIRWGLRGNYRSVPTDCPQRDERHGWLGDRSGESRGESYLFDVAAFYEKWMDDIRDAQRENGSVPDVAPAYWPIYSDNVTWPSSYIVIPGTIYDQYGDRRIIEKHYPTMKKWIDFMRGFIVDGIMPRDTYGDWCVPPEEQHLIHSNDPARKTPGDLIATAYFYHDLELMARYARLLGKEDDTRDFLALAEKLKAAFNAKFFDAESGRYANGAQTASVLPLAFGMVPLEARARVFERLVDKIMVEGNGHIGTGLIGGQWLMRLLSDHGRIDVAYTIATQSDYPSWGYMLGKGATTIWELWNGDTADPAMNSLNHVMLVGDLLTWMHEYLGGIRPDPASPGFKRIVLRPQPVGDLREVETNLRSPHGLIESHWVIVDGDFQYQVTVPVNVRARVYLPAKDPAAVFAGGVPAGVPAAQSPGVTFVGTEDGSVVYEIGSGEYLFIVRKMP